MKLENEAILVISDGSPEEIIALGPALTALKIKHPQSEIGILTSSKEVELIGLLPNIDFHCDEIGELDPTVIYNLSNSLNLKESKENQEWKTYLWSAARIDIGNPYHLIDLQRKVLNLDSVDVNFELLNPQVGEIPELTAIRDNSSLKVAICLASLPTPELNAIFSGISSSRLAIDICLLGTIKDKKTALQLQNEWSDHLSITDLTGRLSSEGIAEVFRYCDIAIAGPSLSTLLSSGFGTFTICVDTSYGHNPLLYPYGHGHLVIQSRPEEENRATLAALVMEALQFTLSGNSGRVPTLEQWQSFADARISTYLGKIRLKATQRVETLIEDQKSFTELFTRPLIYLGAEDVDTLATFNRLCWEHTLNQRTISTNDLEILHQDTVNQIVQILKPWEQIFELANFGRVYSEQIQQSLVKQNFAQAKVDSERLQEVDQLIYQLAESHPALYSISSFHRVRQSLIPDLNPLEMADEMSQIFSNLQARILVLLDLAQSLFHTTFLKESAISQASIEEGQLDG